MKTDMELPDAVYKELKHKYNNLKIEHDVFVHTLSQKHVLLAKMAVIDWILTDKPDIDKICDV